MVNERTHTLAQRGRGSMRNLEGGIDLKPGAVTSSQGWCTAAFVDVLGLLTQKNRNAGTFLSNCERDDKCLLVRALGR